MAESEQGDFVRLVKIIYRFEYQKTVEKILDKVGIQDYSRLSHIHTRDKDGKNFNMKSHPGFGSQVNAVVEDQQALEELLRRMEEFKQTKESHEHLRVVVISPESVL